MSNFSFETPPRVICADGESERLGDLLREFGVSRPLVVTDRGIVEAGLLEPMLAQLRTLGLDVTVFSEVLADPSTTCVEAAVAVALATVFILDMASLRLRLRQNQPWASEPALKIKDLSYGFL